AATADVAAHGFSDIGVRGPAGLFQQRNARHDLARCTVTALIAVELDKSRLHRMQGFGRAEAFDGGDLVALTGRGQTEAGIDAPPVAMHRTGAALSVITALFRAGQLQVLAKQIEQTRPYVDGCLPLLTVDGQAYLGGQAG